MSFIPVVDFSSYFETSTNKDILQQKQETTAKELINAFKEVGFVYLKNCHALVQSSQEIFELSRTFFKQPLDTKMEVRIGEDKIQGYCPVYAEGISNDDVDNNRNLKKDYKQQKGDLREIFQINDETSFGCKIQWPKNLPGFKERLSLFYEELGQATTLVMEAVALGLGLRRDYFDGLIKANSLRLAHYPSYAKTDVETRAGAHTDYGSITFVFQDSVGGLQVANRDGEFIDAPYIPDTVVVNVADMLQRWTNDKLRSVLHRVTTPPSDSAYYPERFSIICFCIPNLDQIIECIPGCEGETGPKYQPIKSGDYLMARVNGHYV